MKTKENIKERSQSVEVKGIMIEFVEYYKIDENTKKEVWDRNLEIENEMRLYDIYKKQKGLLTIQEIKNIRKKYGMNQKEFAKAIGVGEITIHRFEKGSIQTESVDAIIRLSMNPDNMYRLLKQNQMHFEEQNFQSFINKITELQNLKKHCIATLQKNDFSDIDMETVDVQSISSNLIEKYNNQYDILNKEYAFNENIEAEYITSLKLQKLLYYTQGICLFIYKKPAFHNKILNWSYGPVVNEIYQTYKDVGGSPIKNTKKAPNLSIGLNKILDIIVESYGQIESRKLIDLTHEEEPWNTTEKNTEISIEKIQEYFDKVYGSLHVDKFSL